MNEASVKSVFDRLSTGMLAAERYAMEVFLTICSLWAAHVLTSGPSNFVVYGSGYSLMTDLRISEPVWGLVAVLAAGLKVGGLLLTVLDRCDQCGMTLRCLGLLASGFFWMVMGLSFFVGNPDSLTAIPMALMGASAWWTLIRFPTTPGRGVLQP